MAAILRVKRRYDEEPLEALVIACKRCKTMENEEPESSVPGGPVNTIVKFAGTVNNAEANVVEHLAKTLGKEELEANFKRHPINILKKARENTKQKSVENRYKVVNCNRSLDTSQIEEFEDKVMTLIDVEHTGSAQEDSDKEQDESYVYDLYYAKTEEDMFIDVVSVHALNQELLFAPYRNEGNASDEEHDTEDSNSESNWRNDYPDSDHSQNSIDDEDMWEAVGKVKLGEGSDLSSEEYFVDAVEEQDVETYGYRYAKYKAKIKEEFGEDTSDGSESSEPFDRYGSNSSDGEDD